MEGHWENKPGEGTPLILFGIPDMEREETRYAVEIPHLGSLILTHTWDGPIPALKDFAPEDRPDSTVVFWTFRIMVGLGLLMILLAGLSLWLRRGGRLWTSRPFLRFALWMGPSGIVAILAGWFTTEMGRQPWTVYGLMRTADAVSNHGKIQLGAYVEGFKVEGRAFAGGAFDWLTPFSAFTGFGLVVAYALLGSTWLIMKTEHGLQQKAYRLTRVLVRTLLVVMVGISVWTPLTDTWIAERWFSFPNMLFFAPVPVLVALSAVVLLRALKRGGQVTPFMCTLALVFLGYSGLGISLWPNIIPPSVSIWAAAAPPQSQGFALVGALLIIPIILMYTAWSYYVFRGKVKHGEGYH